MNTRIIKSNSHYRHYKGKLYKVIGIARESHTDTSMVIYEDIYSHSLIVNSLEKFNELVDQTLYPNSQKYKYEEVGDFFAE